MIFNMPVQSKCFGRNGMSLDSLECKQEPGTLAGSSLQHHLISIKQSEKKFCFRNVKPISACYGDEHTKE